MATATVGIFSGIASEEKQLGELRQYYIERGVSIDKNGPEDNFTNLKELIGASQFIASLSSERDAELVLNSLLSLFVSYKTEQAVELVEMFCPLLHNFTGQGWNSKAGVAVRVLSALFYLHVDNPRLQFSVLKHLLLAAGRAHLTQFLEVASAERIDEMAVRWTLNMDQKRELYRLLHTALIQDERHESAAEIMHTLLRTYTGPDVDRAMADALECVRTSIIDPKSFCFDHLLHLGAVEALKKTNPLMYELLGIFVHESLPAYRKFISANPTFVREQLRLSDETALEKKIKQLTLISISERQQHVPLALLAKELDIAEEEALEEFIIDAICVNAIQGKINELGGELVVTFYQQRVFGRTQWEQLHQRLATMLENLNRFQANVHSIVDENAAASVVEG